MPSDASVFFLYIETKDSCDYGFDADDEIDYWEFRQTTFVGKKLSTNWELPSHELDDVKLPLRDFVRGYTEAPFVSKYAYNGLRDVLGEHVEFRSIGTLRDEEYYVMNVLTVFDCLDLEKSIISYSPDEPDRILSVNKFIFTDNIPNVPIFKVPQDTGKIFVKMPFIDCIRKNKITGVGFEKPTDIGLIRPNRAFDDLPFL